jgi:SAM-dependent methyltransferase
MIGSELAPYAGAIAQRARDELAVDAPSDSTMLRLAQRYIGIFGVPEIGAHVRIASAVRRAPRTARSVLDIGCGQGMLLGAVARALPQASIAGIEPDVAAARIAHDAHPGATIITGDFLTMDLRPFRVDLAFCIDVLEHIGNADLPAFLQRARSILAPGGMLVLHVPAVNQRRHLARFRDWGHHDHEREGFEAADLVVRLQGAGFVDIAIDRTFGYFGSLAWEANMAVAGSPALAAVFPLALAIAQLDRVVRSERYNGLLATARA